VLLIHPPATERVLTLEKLNEKLPIFTKGIQKSRLRPGNFTCFGRWCSRAPELTLSEAHHRKPRAGLLSNSGIATR